MGALTVPLLAKVLERARSTMPPQRLDAGRPGGGPGRPPRPRFDQPGGLRPPRALEDEPRPPPQDEPDLLMKELPVSVFLPKSKPTFLMLSLAFWTPFVWGITRYVRRLTSATERIASGHFQVTLTLSTL